MKKIQLNIPKKLIHNGEEYRLHGISLQKRKALQIARKIERESKHFRIKFINNKFCIYRESDKK